MITRDIQAFQSLANSLAPDFGPPTARAAFLVAPDGFTRAEQSARDNLYMADAGEYDADRASEEHRELHRALTADLPTICFAGNPATPDAVYPNNVFATVPGRTIIGRMRHPVRQREALRADIRSFFKDTLGYSETDLSTQEHPCELTGAVVIDRARGLGFCGLSGRCDEEGAVLVHEALGLRATLIFDLASDEYHTNLVLAVLAGRAALICPDGFAQSEVVDAIAALYAPHGIVLSPAEHAAFVGNAISLSPHKVWMSTLAHRSLAPTTLAALESAGFEVGSVGLAAIEAGGGSLRCCVGEIF